MSRNQCILHNNLRTASRVVDSEIGSDFSISGSPDYGVTRSQMISGVNIDDDSEILNIANTPSQYDFVVGCIEFWFKPSYNVTNGIPGDGNKHRVWSWWDTGNGWQHVITFHNTVGLAWDINDNSGHGWYEQLAELDMTANNFYHLGFSWKYNHATKKRVVYLNGVEIGNSNLAWNDQSMTAADFKLGVSEAGEGWTGNIGGVVSNFKWWNYDKTDFSDRFERNFGSAKHKRRVG